MATKSRFIGVRFEPEQQRKLIMLSMKAGDPGNMSAGLRYAVDRIAVSGSVSAEVLAEGNGQQAEREAAHA
jgi:hypothetical protein